MEYKDFLKGLKNHLLKHKPEERSLVYGEAGRAHRDEGSVGSRSPINPKP